MPEYRRAYRPGGTFFFTIVTHRRRPLFADVANIQRLRRAIGDVKNERPFDLTAAVILPDHLHFIWTLPTGDADYSGRIGRMKVLFTRSLAGTKWEGLARSEGLVGSAHPTKSRRQHRESQVWQRRFWEHTIRDEKDFEHHLNYLHYNPVKYRLCKCPHQWDASSFSNWVARSAYELDWQCQCDSKLLAKAYPDALDEMVGE